MPSLLALYWRVDYSRQSDFFAAVSNSRCARVDGYGPTNLSIGVRRNDRRWDLMLWTRNLLDEEYFQYIAGRTTGWIAGVPGEPRTAGVTFKGRF